MARKSSSDDNDDILMKGISNANSSINELSEKVGQSQKEIKDLNSKANKAVKATENTAKNTDNITQEVKGLREDVKKGSGRLESKLSELTKAVEKIGTAGGSGSPVQSPVSMSSASGTKTSSSTALVPVGGSKIMGTVPQAALSAKRAPVAQLPGSKVPLLTSPTTQSPAQVAQGNRLINSIKGVGTGIKNFLGGRTFWGKMAGAVAEGLIASKLFSNTIGDLLKLGVFLISNFVRNIFGKHMAGITYILLSMVAPLAGLGALMGGLRNLRRAGNLGHGLKFAGKSAFAGATRWVRHPLQSGKRLISTGVVAKIAGEETKLLENKAVSKAGGKVAEKTLGKTLAKGAAKTVGKKITGLGLLVGGGLAAGRAMQGDWFGAGGELLSGALGGLGGPLGTVASLGLDAWLMKRDMDVASGKKVMGMKSTSVTKGAGLVKGMKDTSATKGAGLAKGPVLKTLGKIAIGITIISDIIKKIWDFFKGGPFSGKEGLWERVTNFFGGSNKGSAGPVGKQDKVQNKLNEVLYGKDTMKGFDSHQVTSNYGWRIHPTKGGSRFHRGVDLAYSEGEQVQAKLGGKIIAAQSFDGYGNTVIVDSGDAYELYGHLSEFGSGISVGKKISKNAVIGLAGHTGEGTGAHLHYEVRKKANAKTAGSIQNFFASKDVNPIKFTTEKQKAEAKAQDSVPTVKPKETTKPAAVKTTKAERITKDTAMEDIMGTDKKSITSVKAQPTVQSGGTGGYSMMDIIRAKQVGGKSTLGSMQLLGGFAN